MCTHCCRSETFVNLSSYVHVSYIQGSWSGFLGSDIINITSLTNLSTFRANVALMTESSDFFVNGSNWHGILGLAFSELAQVTAAISVSAICLFVERESLCL